MHKLNYIRYNGFCSGYMEINEDYTNEQTQAVNSEFAIARESATTTCVLTETQRQAEKWESFTVTK